MLWVLWGHFGLGTFCPGRFSYRGILVGGCFDLGAFCPSGIFVYGVMVLEH